MSKKCFFPSISPDQRQIMIIFFTMELSCDHTDSMGSNPTAANKCHRVFFNIVGGRSGVALPLDGGREPGQPPLQPLHLAPPEDLG